MLIRIVMVVDLYSLLPTDNYLPEKGVSTKAEFHIQNTDFRLLSDREGLSLKIWIKIHTHKFFLSHF